MYVFIADLLITFLGVIFVFVEFLHYEFHYSLASLSAFITVACLFFYLFVFFFSLRIYISYSELLFLFYLHLLIFFFACRCFSLLPLPFLCLGTWPLVLLFSLLRLRPVFLNAIDFHIGSFRSPKKESNWILVSGSLNLR